MEIQGESIQNGTPSPTNPVEIVNKTIAPDISLCTNEFCHNKCKRYWKNWIPNTWQSYINPPTEFTIDGDVKPCKLRME